MEEIPGSSRNYWKRLKATKHTLTDSRLQKLCDSTSSTEVQNQSFNRAQWNIRASLFTVALCVTSQHFVLFKLSMWLSISFGFQFQISSWWPLFNLRSCFTAPGLFHRQWWYTRRHFRDLIAISKVLYISLRALVHLCTDFLPPTACFTFPFPTSGCNVISRHNRQKQHCFSGTVTSSHEPARHSNIFQMCGSPYAAWEPKTTQT